jgi:hypothetical protein
MDCSLKWEDVSQRNKRLSSSSLASGSMVEEDEAAAFLQIWNLIPHRRYRLKVMVNSRYRPTPRSATTATAPGVGADPKKKGGKGGKSKFIQVRDDPEEIRLSRAGYLSILTDPDPPLQPEFLQPDIIHYDHKAPLGKTSSSSSGPIAIPSQLQRTEEEQIELLLEDRGVSVVDKLERYKDLMATKRTATGSLQKSAKGVGLGGKKSSSSSTRPLDDVSTSSPIDHRTGVTERRVSCRLNWTIPYSNGNRVVEYQIQRLSDSFHFPPYRPFLDLTIPLSLLPFTGIMTRAHGRASPRHGQPTSLIHSLLSTQAVASPQPPPPIVSGQPMSLVGLLTLSPSLWISSTRSAANPPLGYPPLQPQAQAPPPESRRGPPLLSSLMASLSLLTQLPRHGYCPHKRGTRWSTATCTLSHHPITSSPQQHQKGPSGKGPIRALQGKGATHCPVSTGRILRVIPTARWQGRPCWM